MFFHKAREAGKLKKEEANSTKFIVSVRIRKLKFQAEKSLRFFVSSIMQDNFIRPEVSVI